MLVDAPATHSTFSSLLFLPSDDSSSSSALHLDLHSATIQPVASSSSTTLEDYQSQCLPPSYTPSSARPPAYTSLAASTERVLLGRRRRQHQHEETSHIGQTHIVITRVGAVELLDQPAGSIPSYSHEALVRGRVRLDPSQDPRKVQEIVVSVSGRIHTKFTGQIDQTHTFLESSHALLASTDDARVFDFAIPLPATIPNNGAAALPPSYVDDSAGARVAYTLVANVTLKRSGIALPLSRSREIVVPFHYRVAAPRRSERAPLPRDATFEETIKQAPDEWTSVDLRAEPLQKAAAGLDIEVAFPSSRVFAPGERLPLHVQLSGDAAAIASLAASRRARSPSRIRKSVSPACSPLRSMQPLPSSPAPSSISIDYLLPPSPLANLSRTSSRDTSSPRQTLSAFSPLSSTDTLVSLSSLKLSPVLEFQPPFTIQIRLERRTVTTDHCARRHIATSVLASADFNSASIVGPGHVAFDGVLDVPDTAATDIAGFRAGPLVVCDALVIAVVPTEGNLWKRTERAIPVQIAGELWEDSGEPAEFAGW